MIEYIINDGNRLDFEFDIKEEFEYLYDPLDIRLADQLLCMRYEISNEILEINKKMYLNKLIMH